MSDNSIRKPTVLIPYTSSYESDECNDICVYLRPETNGVEVESILLRVIHGNPEYKNRLKLAYLANIPGDFIVAHKIIEKYYSLQLYFTTYGKKAFTLFMRQQFEEYFGMSFTDADIISPFDAVKKLNISYTELFDLRVPKKDMFEIHRQTIKRYNGYFILNYDIPAILHKNNNKTDIAVMIFRTDLGYSQFRQVIDEMGNALITENVLHPGKPLSRIFHYSKGPFDQIRDAIGYLYTKDVRHVNLKRIAFSNYLIEKGITMHQILGALKKPLMYFTDDDQHEVECDIFSYTKEDSYKGAYEKYVNINSQAVLY